MSCIENVCTFDARGSTDENAPTLTYSWNFGNGTGSGPLPTRTYTSANTYTVTLTARDEWGVTGTATQTVTIVEPPGNVAAKPGAQSAGVRQPRLQLLWRGLGGPEYRRHLHLPVELRRRHTDEHLIGSGPHVPGCRYLHRDPDGDRWLGEGEEHNAGRNGHGWLSGPTAR